MACKKEIDYNKWNNGPPPSLGWWPASTGRNHQILRWWNGVNWSVPINIGSTAGEAAVYAATPDEWKLPIQWTHRPKFWPERSRT